jgi:thioredoxin reductase (NADPH)
VSLTGDHGRCVLRAHTIVRTLRALNNQSHNGPTLIHEEPEKPERCELLIIGAGPAGIALAAEGCASGIDPSQIVLLEKGPMPLWTVRQFYPDKKLTTANYKGYAANCEGLLCITDMTKSETIEFFDGTINQYGLQVRCGEEVFAMRRMDQRDGMRFHITTSKGAYEARVLAVAIGILGRPNKPRDYSLPNSLKDKLLFEITSQRIEGLDVLVVGGGDTACEYVQHLHFQGNHVTLSYRGEEFTRLNHANHAELVALEQEEGVSILRGSNIARLEDESGRPRVSFKEERYHPRSFDRLIYALGGTTPTNFLRTLGIEFEDERPKYDETGETNIPGLFLLGDLSVSRSGGSIITAFNTASRAMRRIREQRLP